MQLPKFIMKCIQLSKQINHKYEYAQHTNKQVFDAKMTY